MKKQTNMAKFSKTFRKQSRVVKFGLPAVIVLAVAAFGVNYVTGGHAATDSIHCSVGVCGPGEIEDRNGQFMAGSGNNKWIRLYGGYPPPITSWDWYRNGSDAYGQVLWQVPGHPQRLVSPVDGRRKQLRY